MERERSLRIYAKGDAVGVYKLGRILSHWSKFTGANLSKKKALRKYFPCETILVKRKTLTESGVHLSRISENKSSENNIQANCGKFSMWRCKIVHGRQDGEVGQVGRGNHCSDQSGEKPAVAGLRMQSPASLSATVLYSR